jgi:aspartate aminotransferase-like enzyme
MGYSSRPENVLKLLAALEELLSEQRTDFDRGSAVAAANAAFGRSQPRNPPTGGWAIG